MVDPAGPDRHVPPLWSIGAHRRMSGIMVDGRERATTETARHELGRGAGHPSPSERVEGRATQLAKRTQKLFARGGHDQGMDVTIGHSLRWGRTTPSAPCHLIVDVANRQVLACTGGAGDRMKAVPFDAVIEELTCGPCRAFWRRVMTAPNA